MTTHFATPNPFQLLQVEDYQIEEPQIEDYPMEEPSSERLPTPITLQMCKRILDNFARDLRALLRAVRRDPSNSIQLQAEIDELKLRIATYTNQTHPSIIDRWQS